MLAAHDAGDAGDREALAWVRGLPAPDAYADADDVHPLSWWLAGRPPPPSDGDRRELAAHGHPDGWLQSLRQLYAGVDPSFSATSMALLARYARVLDRARWIELARGVEGDGDSVAGYAVAAWIDAYADAALDGDGAEGGDAASWSPNDDDDDGSTPTP
jgi:hypothetical protein